MKDEALKALLNMSMSGTTDMHAHTHTQTHTHTITNIRMLCRATSELSPDDAEAAILTQGVINPLVGFMNTQVRPHLLSTMHTPIQTHTAHIT